LSNFFRSYYLTPRFYWALGGLAFLFLLAYLLPWLFVPAELMAYLLIIACIGDTIYLFLKRNQVNAERSCAEKFSNGDENAVKLVVESSFQVPVMANVIDELPAQFQLRDQHFEADLLPLQPVVFNYELRPVKRGAYDFGLINVFVETKLGLARRRFQLGQAQEVAVYPSYVQMRKYELLAISNQLNEFGVKKIRRIGNNMEFEQIKNYVSGDDYRKVNWKATARRNQLMVNQYQEEKSQHVYSVIDKGRMMQQPFEGLSLLDYAINASLAISNIALRKGDKAGVVTFQQKVNSFLPSSSRNMQLNLILEHLYKQKTAYKESDYGKLYATLRRKVSQRSLILLYTNFESLSSMHRQLASLQKIAKQHLLVCIFFENTEVDALIHSKANDVEEVYTKGIAEQLVYEKKVIVKELKAHGIQAVLTRSQDLTVNTINKYLELKSRGLI
jgi:uncharacterized protein (DUF58 family)